MLLTAATADPAQHDALMSVLLRNQDTLESIQSAIWLIFIVMAALWGIQALFKEYGWRSGGRNPHWRAIVEAEYDNGNYEAALETLADSERKCPRSVLIAYWQGRCHFQLEDWANAAEKLEYCYRREPPYRKAVRDYLAFIEEHELVPGIEGYLKVSKAEE